MNLMGQFLSINAHLQQMTILLLRPMDYLTFVFMQITNYIFLFKV